MKKFEDCQFEIINSPAGITFSLKLGKQTLLTSRPYRTLCDAERGIDQVRRYCDDARHTRFVSDNNSYRLEFYSNTCHVVAAQFADSEEDLLKILQTIRTHAPLALCLDRRPNRRTIGAHCSV